MALFEYRICDECRWRYKLLLNVNYISKISTSSNHCIICGDATKSIMRMDSEPRFIGRPVKDPEVYDKEKIYQILDEYGVDEGDYDTMIDDLMKYGIRWKMGRKEHLIALQKPKSCPICAFYHPDGNDVQGGTCSNPQYDPNWKCCAERTNCIEFRRADI